MTVLLYAILLLAGVTGTIVVFTRDPHRQVFALAANGFVLAILFFVLQAPDVAISEIGVGAAIVPLLFLVALTAIRNEDQRQTDRKDDAA